MRTTQKIHDHITWLAYIQPDGLVEQERLAGTTDRPKRDNEMI